MADIALVSATARTLTCQAIAPPDGTVFIRWYICLPGNEGTSFPFNGHKSSAMENWTYWTFEHIGKPVDDGGDPSTWVDLQPNTTYAVKVSFRDGSAAQNAIGSAITRYFTTAATDRPTSWAWESSVASGAAFSMTAAEWNRFIDRIFAFAAYKGTSLGGSAGSYYVTAGTKMLASQVNAARALVAALNPPTAPPGQVSKGQPITAAWFNAMKTSLNSIT